VQGPIEFRSALHQVSLITADGSIYWRTQQRCSPETTGELLITYGYSRPANRAEKRDRRSAQLRRIFFIFGLPGYTWLRLAVWLIVGLSGLAVPIFELLSIQWTGQFDPMDQSE
jgi:hypothetical protein